MENLLSLKGKKAVVTGGSRGIGRTIAIRLAQAGADIAILYVGDEAEAKESVELIEKEGVKVLSYYCNVADLAETEENIKKVISEFGRIDILVNNAGITRDNLILKMTEADFDAVINVNLKGAFNTTKSVYSHMAKNRSGKIINIASVSGLLGTAGQANYASSKAGLIGLTKVTARELGARGVTCNAIAPGYIQTDMTASLKDEIKQEYMGKIPVRQFGTVENIADTTLFLASEMASYITGEVIRVDGGLCM